MKLTKKEQAVYARMIDHFRGNSCAVGWTSDCRPVEISPRSYPGVVSSLVKKGLVQMWTTKNVRIDSEFFLPGIK